MKPINCILLVDDDFSSNFLNKRLIEKVNLPAQIKVARTGDEALDYLNQCRQSEDEEYIFPDLIFLDINMPRMNGWEFLDEYRQLDFIEQHPSVIFILTTSPNRDDESKAGIYSELSGFLKKPLTKDILLQIIEEHFDLTNDEL